MFKCLFWLSSLSFLKRCRFCVADKISIVGVQFLNDEIRKWWQNRKMKYFSIMFTVIELGLWNGRVLNLIMRLSSDRDKLSCFMRSVSWKMGEIRFIPSGHFWVAGLQNLALFWYTHRYTRTHSSRGEKWTWLTRAQEGRGAHPFFFP